MVLETVWKIEEDTVLANVFIKCYTHNCINVQPGVNLKIVKSTIQGHRVGRCIIAYSRGDLVIQDSTVQDCGHAINTERGGAIQAIGSRNVEIISSNLLNNKAVSVGGAIAAEPLSRVYA